MGVWVGLCECGCGCMFCGMAICILPSRARSKVFMHTVYWPVIYFFEVFVSCVHKAMGKKISVVCELYSYQ